MKTLKEKLATACEDYLSAAFCHPNLFIDKPLVSANFTGGMDFIFESAKELAMRRRAITLQNLTSQMELDNIYVQEKVEKQAEDMFLQELLSRNSSYADGCFAWERVVAFSQRVAIINAAERIAYFASKEDDDIVDTLAKIDKCLMTATEIADIDDVETMSETLKKTHAKMVRAQAGIIDPSVMSGFHELDALTMGFKEGEVIILGGRPAMGKTAMAVQIGMHAAKNGIGTLLLSMEMSKEGIDRRNIAAETGLHRRSQFSANDSLSEALPKIMAMSEEPWAKNFSMSERRNMTIAQIRATATRAVRRNPKLKLLIVDYLQLAQGNSKHRQEEIAEISRFLKALAGELKITILAAAQLSRNLANREDRRPQLTDLRESGQIEQDADMVLFVHREHYYDQSANPNEAEIIVAKNRNDVAPIIKVGFEGASFTFTNQVAQWDGPPGTTPFDEARPAQEAPPARPSLAEIMAGNKAQGRRAAV